MRRIAVEQLADVPVAFVEQVAKASLEHLPGMTQDHLPVLGMDDIDAFRSEQFIDGVARQQGCFPVEECEAAVEDDVDARVGAVGHGFVELLRFSRVLLAGFLVRVELISEGLNLFDQLLLRFSAGDGHLLSQEDRFCVRLSSGYGTAGVPAIVQILCQRDRSAMRFGSFLYPTVIAHKNLTSFRGAHGL